MKTLIKKAVNNKFVARLLMPLLIKLDNYCYYKISKLSVILNDGVHPKHRLMGYHHFFVDNISAGDYVIDIGCGIGANTFSLAKKAKKVIGIDISKTSLDYAKKHYSAQNIDYIYGDITKELIGKFDVAVLSNVLEHIEDRVEFLESVKKISPKILIRVPMANRDWLVLYKKELNSEWRLDKTHYTEYTLGQLKIELGEAGLSIKDYSIQFGEIWAIVINKR